MQYGHRLAGAGAAGHLSRAGVTGLVGDVALARVQERAPRRERVSEDVPQLLRAGHEGDLAGSALHGGDQVVRVYVCGPSAGRHCGGGGEPGRLRQRLVHGHAAGQRVQRGVLGLRPRFPDCLQVGFRGQRAGRRPELRVDAEPGQVGVADVGEQALACWFRGGAQVLDGFLVTDFHDSERPVDGEPAARGVGVRLVLREDCDQAVRVSVRVRQHRGRRGEDDAAPAAVHRHEADPVVPAVPRLLQVLAWVQVPGEGGDGSVDGPLHVLVQLRVLAQEAFRDRQACHRLTSSPCQLALPKRAMLDRRAAAAVGKEGFRWGK